MPKVLRIINRFNIGGPTYNAAYLSRHLAPDYKTLLVGGMKDETEDSSEYILDQVGVRPIIIPEMRRSIRYNDDLVAYYKIKEVIRRFRPDIVHTHASKAGSLGRWAAYHSNVPVIIHTFHGHVFHSYFNKTKTALYKQIERKLARHSTRIIALSDIQKHELSSVHHICEPEKIEVIPLGFDLSRFREDMELKRASFRAHYKLDEDEVAIGIIGRLVPIKNHKLFLDALARVLQQTTRKVRAFIIGDGELMQELQQYAAHLNIPFAIGENSGQGAPLTFTSWIKEVDYANAGLDIVALTSLNEGTPVSLIEAQAANKPIVTTGAGGIENVVIAGKTALLARNGDAEDFAARLLSLVENDMLRTSMSQYGWDHVKRTYHYTRLVDDMKNLYDRLLDVRRVPAGVTLNP